VPLVCSIHGCDSVLKTVVADARLNRLNSAPPIRSRASEEGDFQIPLWGIPFLLFLLCVCLFSGLGSLGLVGPDEPRYAAIARAMAESHDWITPRLWGSPWFEKPVLYYWSAGIAMRIFGVNEFAARLPSALATLVAIVAVKWTALRSYGLGAAWYSLLMLPASVAIIGFSRAAGPDMLFAGLITAAMAVGSEMLQTSRPGTVQRIAFGFFLGAAVLAKGPAAVILAGSATLLWAALSGQWRAPFRFLHPLVILVFCLTALPWYVLCALRNPDFLRVFIWQHNFERYLTPMFQHRQPFWYYVPVLLAASFPWCVIAFSVLGGFSPSSSAKSAPLKSTRVRHPEPVKWKNGAWRDSPGLFILCWALFPFLFFSFSQSKLPGYILPAVFPGFLLMARAAAREFSSGGSRAGLWTGITGALLMVFAGAAARPLAVNAAVYRIPESHLSVLLLSLFATGVIAVFLSLKQKQAQAVALIAVLMAAVVIIMNVEILPAADAQISARSLVRDSQPLMQPEDSVAVHGLNRNWNYGLSYYFARELPEWKPDDPLPQWLFTSQSEAMKLVHPGSVIRNLSAGSSSSAVLLHTPAAADDPR